MRESSPLASPLCGGWTLHPASPWQQASVHADEAAQHLLCCSENVPLGEWLARLSPSHAEALCEALSHVLQHPQARLDIDVCLSLPTSHSPQSAPAADDCSERWLWFTARLSGGDGRPPVFEGLVVDVSARRRREDHARQDAARLTELLERLPAGVAYVMVDTMTMRANGSFRQMIGYSEDELAQVTWKDFTHPDDIDQEEQLTARMFAGEIDDFVLEKRYVQSRGRIFWGSLRLQLVRDELQRPHYLIALVDDITARKNAQARELVLQQRLAEQQAQLETLVAHVPGGLLRLDRSLRCTFVTQRFADWLGRQPQDVVGRPIGDWVTVDDFARLEPKLLRVLSGESVSYSTVMAQPHGREHHGRVNLVPERDGAGQVLGVIATFHDLTDLVRAQWALEASEARMQSLLHALPERVWFKDLDGRYQVFNQGFVQQCGRQPEEVRGRTDAQLFGPEAAARFVAGDHEALASGGPISHREAVVLPGQPQECVFEVSKAPVFDRAGQAMGVLGVARDVSEREHADAQRRRVAERMELVMIGADLAFWDRHIPSGERTVNDRWYTMLGYQAGEVGTHFGDWQALVHPDDLPRMLKASADHVSGLRTQYECEFRMQHRDGHWVWILARGKVVERDAQGQPMRIAGTNMDITARKKLQSNMVRMAECDALTGALSRSRFLELAQAEVLRAQRQSDRVVVLVLGIDHFKRINETHGQAAGDKVLQEFVRIVARELRPTDLLGRVGGKEFAALLHADRAVGAAMAERIVDAVRTCELLLDGPSGSNPARLTCTSSVGACLLAPTDAHLDALLQRAERALERAKHLGRCRVAWDALA